MKTDEETYVASGVADGASILKALNLQDQHVSRIEITIDASELIECKITRELIKGQVQQLASALDGVQLEKQVKLRKLVPLKACAQNTYVAPGSVLAVYDTNGDGTLLQVAYRLNPIDDIEFNLVHAPYGQIYAEIHSN